MKTKTLKFDDEVLDVLRRMRWSADGRLGVISEQLERSLYVRTNKALEAMGGKWNRKAGGHEFPEDPRPAVDGLVENGAITVEVSEMFATPDKIIDLMFAKARAKFAEADLGGFYLRCLEPSAGTGAILRCLSRHSNVRIDWCEIDERLRTAQETHGISTTQGYGPATGQDFLEYAPGPVYDLVLMNPPFSAEVEHVRHAWDLLAPGGRLVTVMSEGPFFREFARDREFRAWLETVGGESEKLPDGSFLPATGVNTRLVVIDK